MDDIRKLNARREPAGPWFRVKAEADSATIYIYDEIDPFWGLSSDDLVREIDALDVSEIQVRINSPGGSVFDGHAIYNALRRHKARVVSHVDALAGSIASEIMLAADHVNIAANARVMIHEGEGIAYGRAARMKQIAGLLETLNDDIAAVYSAKTGKDASEVRALMDAETWFTADEALAAGLVDEITEELKIAACFDYKALGYKHVPPELADEAAAAVPPAATTITLTLTPEMARALAELEVPDATRDTQGTIDMEAVAQILRARFE